MDSQDLKEIVILFSLQDMQDILADGYSQSSLLCEDTIRMCRRTWWHAYNHSYNYDFISCNIAKTISCWNPTFKLDYLSLSLMLFNYILYNVYSSTNNLVLDFNVMFNN